jgi:hypothetical protein
MPAPARIKYIGICFNDHHRRLLRERLADKVLEHFAKPGLTHHVFAMYFTTVLQFACLLFAICFMFVLYCCFVFDLPFKRDSAYV